MNQEQCPIGNGMPPVKSDEVVCETCLLLALQTTGAGNIERLASALATGMTSGIGQGGSIETDNAWEVCSANEPVDAYAMVANDEFGENPPNPVQNSEGVFNDCLCDAGLLPIEDCEEDT